jgi:hypothetical protein
MAAHVPLLNSKAGNGHVWYVVDWINIEPVGKANLDDSYHFLNELTSFLPIYCTVPSFFRFYPKN